jgi:hypothetical protein
MTFRELINEVLIRLREETIATDWSGNINDSTAVTDYQKVVASLINDSKRNIETYHDWLILRETVDIATVSGTRSYNLSSGQELKVLDVINQTVGTHLVQVSRQYMNSTRYPNENSGNPQYYAFNGADSSNNLKVDLEPKPDSVETISFDVVKYQDELTTASTVVKIPYKPVVLGAWARAIAERGEDGGTQTSIVAQEAADSISQAIMIDSGHTNYETDWVVT